MKTLCDECFSLYVNVYVLWEVEEGQLREGFLEERDLSSVLSAEKE